MKRESRGQLLINLAATSIAHRNKFFYRVIHMQKMNYLSICKVVTANLEANYFIGSVQPKIYDGWKQLSAQVLFFEGLHQFAVKIARLIEKATSVDGEVNQKKYIPAKLYNLNLDKIAECENYYIQGSVLSYETIFKVAFKVFRSLKELDHGASEITKGSIIVSIME